MDYIHWFPNIEPALHYWDKPHFIIVYIFLYIAGFDLEYFIKDFNVYVH